LSAIDLKEWIKSTPELPTWRKPQDPKAFKAWREKNKLTQAALGKMLGVTYLTVLLIEKGERDPGGPMLRLLQLLGAWKP